MPGNVLFLDMMKPKAACMPGKYSNESLSPGLYIKTNKQKTARVLLLNKVSVVRTFPVLQGWPEGMS